MNVIFLCHNDLGSSLVRSQVLPYLRGLAERGHVIHLLTFERARVVHPRGELGPIRWTGIPAHPGTGLMSKVRDLLEGIWVTIRTGRQLQCELIHARSYLPALIATLAGSVLRVPFVFDMRGFLGEEYVEGGHWRPGDLRYRLLVQAERLLLSRAAHIVVLTNAAARRLRTEQRYSQWVASKSIDVVRCGVELSRFVPLPRRETTPTLVYSGSVGMTYRLADMLRVYKAAKRRIPALRLRIYNQGQHEFVRAALEQLNMVDSVELASADFSEMPRLIARCHVGLTLLAQGESKTGSSAIKVAEYLACGLPVIVNAGAGDMEELLREGRAGHVMRSYDDDEISRAAEAIVHLLGRDDAQASARSLAEREFDVSDGVNAYAQIYDQIYRRRGRLVD